MIRKAKIEDSNNIAKLIIRGWQTAYKGLINQEFLDSMREDEMSEGWKKKIFSQNESDNIYVYEKENKILGVIRFGKVADQNDINHNAEIHVLYVEPKLKRNGIGSKLFDYAKNYFIEHNMKKLIIAEKPSLAQKIIKKELQQDPNVILDNILALLKGLSKDETKITLRVNPAQVSLLKTEVPSLLEEAGLDAKILVVPDDSIMEGGCVVTTTNGVIDATIETQLAVISEALRGI